MTNEEALKTLESMKAEIEWEYPMDYQIALDMAIDALEKHTHKKPLSEQRIVDLGKDFGKKEITIFHCPVCSHTVLAGKCCLNNDCRQALDWSDIEDIPMEYFENGGIWEK